MSKSKYYSADICGALTLDDFDGENIKAYFDDKLTRMVITDAASRNRKDWVAYGITEDGRGTKIYGAVSYDNEGRRRAINLPGILKNPERWLGEGNVKVNFKKRFSVSKKDKELYDALVFSVAAGLAEEQIKNAEHHPQ